MEDFCLTDNMNSRNAARVVDHLREPRLWVPTEDDYGPAHEEWLEKTEAELAVDKNRHALMASFGRTIAGALVFRPEPGDSSTIGIRNISINPDFEGRYVGAFTVRNAEFCILERYPDANRVTVDTKITNTAMIIFLLSQGFEPFGEPVDLYDSGKPDMQLEKYF